ARVDGGGRRHVPHTHRALPGPRGGPRASQHAALPRSGAGGAAPAGDAVLPDDLDDGAAGGLGRARAREDASSRAGARAASPRAPAGRPVTARQRADRRAGVAFVAPAVLVLAGLSLYPGLWVLWLSLQQRIPIFGIARFVGLDHYAFLAEDPRMWNA